MLEGIIQQALAAKYGVEIATNDPAAFKRKFYSVRRKLVDGGVLAAKSLICAEPPQGTGLLWLIKDRELPNDQPC